MGCGSDPQELDFSQREATTGECPSGGTVLLVNGEAQAVVCNGADGADGANGTNGTDGVNGTDALLPGLVQETVYCAASSQDGAPYRSIQYKHARLYDGSLFVTVTCDTLNDQDSGSDLFSSAQVGASSGAMNCALVDELNAVIVIAFTPNFLTRRLQVTENGTVAVDYAFDTDCTVVTSP